MYIIYWKLRIEYFLTPVLNKMSAKTLCLSNKKKQKGRKKNRFATTQHIYAEQMVFSKTYIMLSRCSHLATSE